MYVQILLSKWTDQSYCKSDSEISKALTSIGMGFSMADYYFDSDDYSTPLKINVNDELKFWAVSGITKTIELRIWRTDVTVQK